MAEVHLPEDQASRGVEESTRADTSTDPSQQYQYFWWVDTPDSGATHFSARGKYVQYIYVAPEKDLVIVSLGKQEGKRGYDYWTELFENLSTKLDTSEKESRFSDTTQSATRRNSGQPSAKKWA